MTTFTGTKNFTLNEMRCKDGTFPKDMAPLIKHANRMQALRDWYRKPMIVNSWYRSPSHNAKVGGVKNSRHLTGEACDISLPKEFHTFTAARKQEWVYNMSTKWHKICGGGGGFGIYDTFMHIDSRPNYTNFDYRKKKDYTVKWK